MNRRIFLAGGSALLLAGCNTTQSNTTFAAAEPVAPPPGRPQWLVPASDERFPVAPVDISKIPPQFHRQEVDDPTGERPGTIVVDTDGRFVYLVGEGGRAMRYGCGIGRDGFAWSGDAVIRRKAAWPRWTPPAEMVARDPEAAKWAGGMPGGPENPLGARALYLYEGNRDTLYRLHGTAEPWSIGRAVSSGCVRLLNADVIDLYDRVPVGSRVKVIEGTATRAA